MYDSEIQRISHAGFVWSVLQKGTVISADEAADQKCWSEV